jgi:hypothetical protein
MWNVVKRGLLPGLLMILGLASLIYGSRFHNEPVLTESTSEQTIEVPDMSVQTFPDGRGFTSPPPMRKQTVQKTEEVTIYLPEPAIVKDVSVGGLVLAAKSGQLKRTYSGKAPSLCPT